MTGVLPSLSAAIPFTASSWLLISVSRIVSGLTLKLNVAAGTNFSLIHGTETFSTYRGVASDVFFDKPQRIVPSVADWQCFADYIRNRESGGMLHPTLSTPSWKAMTFPVRPWCPLPPPAAVAWEERWRNRKRLTRNLRSASSTSPLTRWWTKKTRSWTQLPATWRSYPLWLAAIRM